MKNGNLILIILACICILFNACSNNIDEKIPGVDLGKLHFDATEKTIDFKNQNVIFKGDDVRWFVSYVREVMGSDTSGYSLKYGNDEIDGIWYNVKTTDNKLIVNISENKSDEPRELILNLSAGGFVGEAIKIRQNNN